ncbi:MAG: hypothetical protein NC336_07910 [Clostridium sp.]|nr:hypothetical protein [Clostridium sp.]
MNLRLSTIAGIAAILLAGMAAIPVSAKYHAPDNTTRVLWDLNSKKVIFGSGNYARIIPLQDGRLMAAAESGAGISVCYSSDEGVNWTTQERIIQNASGVPYAVPDLVQLADGTILVGFNPRPSSPYSEERRFGIRTMRSTDNGKTWEGPIFIYDASYTFSDGCWEPSFLEIPGTGEVHCYFANEYPYQTNNDQEISLCRSFDGGLTWGAAERVCYRAGHRDGMPSAIITDAGEIVVIVEDNGYPRGFRATTMRCTLEQNWHDCWVDANSPNRHTIWSDSDTDNMSWISAAPYIRKLRSGETIASWQGDHWGRPGAEANFDMFVAVGDPDARNFTQVSEPFGLPQTSHALWNSINIGNGDDIFALASIGSPSDGNAINLMKGYAMRGVVCDFGTPTVNASVSRENWTFKNATQIFLGATNTRKRAIADFLYDNDNLYFYTRVVDSDIYTDKIDNDGVYIYLDMNNACDTYPQDGEFRIFMNVDGTVDWCYGANNRWTTAEEVPEGVDYEVAVSKTYYQMEIAIPWRALGFSGPVDADHTMRCNVEVRDRREGALLYEPIPQTAKNASWTWPEFHLNEDPRATAIPTVAADGDATSSALTVRALGSGEVSVESAGAPVASLSVFSADGKALGNFDCGGAASATVHTGLTGLVILRAAFADGSFQTCKLQIR